MKISMKFKRLFFYISILFGFIFMVAIIFSFIKDNQKPETQNQVTKANTFDLLEETDIPSLQPPTEPEQSITLENLEDSAVTEESEQPVTPEEAEQPVTPEEAEQPVTPEEAEQPVTPQESEQPALPQESTAPEQSEQVQIESSLELDSTSIIVYNFSELKTALTSDNGYTTIYFGADITMTAGINIHASKLNVTIDGINPLDPGHGPFQLTDMNSPTTLANTIYINSNSGTKNLTVRNLAIIGKNYYGSFCIGTSALNVLLSYENVTYSGPQMTYNRYGTTRYIDCTVNIDTSNGSGAPIEELGEVKNVVMGGKTSITSSSSANSCLWFLGSNCTFDILPNADINISIPNNYMIYCDLGNVACTVGNGAKFTVSTKYGMFYNNTVGVHAFSDFVIADNAIVNITQSTKSSTSAPTIKVNNNLQVNPSAKLYVSVNHASAYSLIRFMTNGAGATFNDPETVLLSNTDGKLFDWYTGSGHVVINSGVVDYFTTAATLNDLSTFSEMPAYYWSKNSGINFNVDITASSSATTNVVSNFESGVDDGTPPSTTTLNMITARMLSFGHLPLTINTPVTSASRVVAGSTYPLSNIRLEYNPSKKLEDLAHSNGHYAIALAPDDNLAALEQVKVTSHNDYKIISRQEQIIEVPPGILSFKTVPDILSFPTSEISNAEIAVQRNDPDWSIVISDTRAVGQPWSVFVSVSKPLSYQDESGQHTLPEALVFIDTNGDEQTLYEGSTEVFEGVKTADEMTLSWHDDSGILIKVFAPAVRTEKVYTATLTWILSDTP